VTRDLGVVLQGHTWGRGGSFVAESVKASGSFPKSCAFFSRRTGLSFCWCPFFTPLWVPPSPDKPRGTFGTTWKGDTITAVPHDTEVRRSLITTSVSACRMPWTWSLGDGFMSPVSRVVSVSAGCACGRGLGGDRVRPCRPATGRSSARIDPPVPHLAQGRGRGRGDVGLSGREPSERPGPGPEPEALGRPQAETVIDSHH
jgi:hypothetical protein